MKYYSNLFNKKTNVEEIACLITNFLNVRVVKSDVIEKIHNHPHPLSLLAIHDVLSEYEVESTAFKCNNLNNLLSEEIGFVAQIRNRGDDQELFAFVYGKKGDALEWYNPRTHRKENIGIGEFLKVFSGIVLLFEATDGSGDHEYDKHLLVEKRKFMMVLLLTAFLPIVFVCLVVWIFFLDGKISFFSILFTCFLFMGCYVGVLLFSHEFSLPNPAADKICNFSKRTNCDFVLSSKASKLWDIPWSVLGNTYFLGLLSAMLISSFDEDVYALSAFIHLLSLPYVVYSLYVQKYVLRQWCPLCILVLVVLLLLFVTALVSGIYSHFEFISLKSFSVLSISLFLSFFLVSFLWNYYTEIDKRDYLEINFKQIKYDFDLYDIMLHNEESIEMPENDCGIIMGNPDGRIVITNVCSPFCGFCATLHPILERMLANNPEIRLQTVFVVDPDSPHHKYSPVESFLALYYEGEDIGAALSEWFAKRDLDDFKKNHPINGGRANQIAKNIKEMSEFVKKNEIIATPTIFVDNHRLPSMYNASDLQYLY